MKPNTDAMLTRLVRRFAYVRPSNIEVLAERFVAASGHPEVPREPEPILDAFGIALIGRGLKRGWAGHWHRTEDGYEVFINHHHGLPRRRFTAFHEAFEILCQLPAFPRGVLTDEELHRMADQFAAAVLMPERPLRDEAAALHHPEIDKADVLAERFGVSISAMRIRLRQLKLTAPREPWRSNRYGRLGEDGPEDWEDRGRRDAERMRSSESD